MKRYGLLSLFLLTPWLCYSQSDSLKLQQAIGEVVIVGDAHPIGIRHTPMNISTLTSKKIESQHNSSLLPTLSQQVPSLFVTSRGVMGYGVSTGAAGGMTMRGIGGSPTTALLITIDNVPQYMGLMGHPIADTCHSMMAESVEVVRGASSVQYGSNAMGGVINITTKRMQQDGVEDRIELSYGSYNTLQSAISNRLKKGRFSSAATATYNRTDGHRANMGFEQLGGNLNLAYEIDSHWSIVATGQLTHFNASNPGSVSSPIIDNDSRITRYSTTISLKNSHKVSSGSLNIFFNGGRHKINDGYSPQEQPLDYRFNSHDEMCGASIYQRLSLMRGNTISLGLDYYHFGGKAWNRYLNDNADKTTADKQMDQVATFVSMSQRIKRVTIDAGIRLDHHSHVGTEWIPQASISLELPHNILLKALASKGFRFPTIREMYMFPPQNPNLKPERIMNYELSLSQTLAEGRFNYGVNIYYINGEDIIRTLPVDGRPQNLNTGKIENWGVETQLSWQIASKWSLEANYSYLNMRYAVVAAPEHKLFAGISFSPKRWHITCGAQLIDGLITSTSPLSKERAFWLLDANAEYSLSPRLRLFARIDNILNTKYQINEGYPMPNTTAMGGLRFQF